jgi:hypothetical protein
MTNFLQVLKRLGTSIYSNIRQVLMNWFAFIVILFNALIAIFSVYTNPQLKKQLRIFSWRPTQQTVFIILIIICLAASFMSIYYQENEQEREKMISSYEGTLRVESTILFSTNERIYPILEIGTSGRGYFWNGTKGDPMITLPDNQYITIYEDRGQLKLSTKLKGKDGLIAEIVDNKWKINPKESWDRNYNKSALEIKDSEGNIVLQVKLLKDRIQFQGKFYDKNGYENAIVGVEGKDWVRTSEPADNQSEFGYKIVPIFKYSSKDHLGEGV